MEKEIIEVGDFALINDLQYPIKDILPDEIIIINPDGSLSSIIEVNGEWKVKYLNIPHTVQFLKKEITLTDIEDIDINIMLYVNDKTLFEFCSEEMHSICNNENFWLHRTLNKFGEWVIKYKSSNETYKQQYYNLVNLFPYYDKLDRPDYIIALAHIILMWERFHEILRLLESEPNNINLMKEKDYLKDHLELLTTRPITKTPPIDEVDNPKVWDRYRDYILKNSYELLYDTTNLNFAKWLSLQAEINDSLYQGTYLSLIAVQLEDIDLLRDVYEKKFLIPVNKSELIETALKKGKFIILEWMIDNNLFDPLTIDRYINMTPYDKANNLLVLLKLLHDKGLLNIDLLRRANFNLFVNDLGLDLLNYIKFIGAPIGMILGAWNIEDINISYGTRILDWFKENQLLLIGGKFKKRAEWWCKQNEV